MVMGVREEQKNQQELLERDGRHCKNIMGGLVRMKRTVLKYGLFLFYMLKSIRMHFMMKLYVKNIINTLPW